MPDENGRVVGEDRAGASWGTLGADLGSIGHRESGLEA